VPAAEDGEGSKRHQQGKSSKQAYARPIQGTYYFLPLNLLTTRPKGRHKGVRASWNDVRMTFLVHGNGHRSKTCGESIG
jgi:hypothetical protein